MKEISTDALQAKLEAGETLNLIDVREVDEVAAGHIPGIINIPLGSVCMSLIKINPIL